MKTSQGDERVELKSTDCEKDRGVHIDSELKFSRHMETRVNKANRILGLIRRSYEYMDGPSMKMMFSALVRPHLEFANSACSPRFEKDRKLIEGVPRRATKGVPGLSNLQYDNMKHV